MFLSETKQIEKETRIKLYFENHIKNRTIPITAKSQFPSRIFSPLFSFFFLFFFRLFFCVFSVFFFLFFLAFFCCKFIAFDSVLPLFHSLNFLRISFCHLSFQKYQKCWKKLLKKFERKNTHKITQPEKTQICHFPIPRSPHTLPSDEFRDRPAFQEIFKQ